MTIKPGGNGGWLTSLEPASDARRLPLRVAVYEALARSIRNGQPSAGSLLPSEAELCDAFAVSRPVAREALLLLEEDGLVVSRRGIGRFVADRIPTVGLEQIQPLERLLGNQGLKWFVQPIKREHQHPTDFTTRALELQPTESSWMWESVHLCDGQPVALSQEWLPPKETLDQLNATLTQTLAMRQEETTALEIMVDHFGGRLGPGRCEISVSSAGAQRGNPLAMSSRSPVLLISQTASVGGRPVYLAKHMIRPGAGRVIVIQSGRA